MRNVGKFFKIIVLGLILIVLSAGYRFFGKKNDTKDDNNFINKAKADTPQDPGCGYDPGCGSGGGGDGGCSGSSGDS